MQCVSRQICKLLVVLEEIKSSGSKLLLGQNLATSLSALDNTNTRSATCTLVNNRSSSLDRSRGRRRCGSRSGSRLLGSQLLLIGSSLGGSGLGFGLLLGSLLLGGLFCCLLLSGLSLGSLLLRLCLGLLGLGSPGISLSLSSLLTLSLGLGLGSLSLLKLISNRYSWGKFNEFGILKMTQIDILIILAFVAFVFFSPSGRRPSPWQQPWRPSPRPSWHRPAHIYKFDGMDSRWM